MFATSSLIRLGRTDQNILLSGDEALSAGGRSAANPAYGMLLVHDFGYGHQMGHRAKWPSAPIGVETRDHHAATLTGEQGGDFNQILTEELPLIDGHQDRGIVNERKHVGGIFNGKGRDLVFVMRGDIPEGVTFVDHRFKDLSALPGDVRAANLFDKFFGLAAKHAAGDDFDPTGLRQGAGKSVIQMKFPLRKVKRP